MARGKITEQEWESFLSVADALGIPVRGLLEADVSFTELEAAGHGLGQAVARIATERLILARAERLIGPQACPACGRSCPVVHRERAIETIDGPVDCCEPVCHCSACRRDFFPSASGVGA